MIRVYEFECSNGHVAEAFIREGDLIPPCPVCSAPRFANQKVLSATRFSLEGITGDFPGAAMQWERKRAQKQAIEERKTRDHGDDNW